MNSLKCLVLSATLVLSASVLAQDNPTPAPPTPAPPSQDRPAPTPPASKPPVLRVSSGVAEGNIIHRVDPVYPAIAISQNISGDVVLNATIGRDGLITNLTAVSGHPILAKAAL